MARCLKVSVHKKLELPETFHECCTREFGGTPSFMFSIPSALYFYENLDELRDPYFQKVGVRTPHTPTALPMLIGRIHLQNPKDSVLMK